MMFARQRLHFPFTVGAFLFFLATGFTSPLLVGQTNNSGVSERLFSSFAAQQKSLESVEQSDQQYPASNLAYPTTATKKGLQVEDVDDAIALGIEHAAINVDLVQLIDPNSVEGNPVWKSAGRSFSFRSDYLKRLDQQVKQLSDQKIIVNAILLAYQSGQADLDQLLIHPNCDPNAPNRLGAFNNRSEQGRQWLTATIEFLADRWSGKHEDFGRVCGWIVGNEVNSHWWWANCGPVTMEKFAADYVQVVRLVNEAVKSQTANDRVYVSLEHHWTIRYPAGNENQSFPARDFLLEFSRLAKQAGDFDWNVAFHPYPENLFDPKFWEDETVTDQEDSPRVTFKNLPVLLNFLNRDDLLFNGKQRRVILSEQGFHSQPTPEGEIVQAAAYCYAYKIVEALDGIDAFILHRHIDHPHEGGLNLGLRRRDPAVGNPDFESQFPRKPIYECFKAAGKPNESTVFEFALPIIGIKEWPR